jgi:hypothetical protein
MLPIDVHHAIQLCLHQNVEQNSLHRNRSHNCGCLMLRKFLRRSKSAAFVSWNRRNTRTSSLDLVAPRPQQSFQNGKKFAGITFRDMTELYENISAATASMVSPVVIRMIDAANFDEPVSYSVRGCS